MDPFQDCSNHNPGAKMASPGGCGLMFYLGLYIVGRMCNNFEKNRELYDKSMKLGTWLVDNKTKK